MEGLVGGIEFVGIAGIRDKGGIFAILVMVMVGKWWSTSTGAQEQVKDILIAGYAESIILD